MTINQVFILSCVAGIFALIGACVGFLSGYKCHDEEENATARFLGKLKKEMEDEGNNE